MTESNGKKNHGGIKRRLLTGIPGISATVATESPIDIFELMITD